MSTPAEFLEHVQHVARQERREEIIAQHEASAEALTELQKLGSRWLERRLRRETKRAIPPCTYCGDPECFES